MDDYPLDEHDLCTVCREGLANFDAAYSFGSYEGSLQQLIHLFKYAKVESLARAVRPFCCRRFRLDANFDLVMAMPMHWRKRWERGFNQAELLGRTSGAALWIAAWPANYERTRYTKSQAGLTETERRDKLARLVQVQRPSEVAGKRILLIDDVFTTGSTLRAAAEVLKAAGAAAGGGVDVGPRRSCDFHSYCAKERRGRLGTWSVESVRGCHWKQPSSPVRRQAQRSSSEEEVRKRKGSVKCLVQIGFTSQSLF